jgi:uncharacterized membrane protein
MNWLLILIIVAVLLAVFGLWKPIIKGVLWVVSKFGADTSQAEETVDAWLDKAISFKVQWYLKQAKKEMVAKANTEEEKEHVDNVIAAISWVATWDDDAEANNG